VKSAIYTGYGGPDVLQVRDVVQPIPADDGVLIRVRAAAVNAFDWRVMRGSPFLLRLMCGLSKPKIRPGRDVAGEVAAIGKNVTRFASGDAVFGTCLGAFAEYACAKASRIALKPRNVTFEQAACIPFAASIALQGLRRGGIAAGLGVLVNGASGGVGTFAVQIAKAYGAEVTAVCGARNVEVMRSIGADHVIDYAREDFTQGPQRYDLIFDGVANHALSAYRRVLKPAGTCVTVGAPGRITSLGMLGLMFKPAFASLVPGGRFVALSARFRAGDLEAIRALTESGKLKPVIDRRYDLDDVARAVAYVEEGHASGKVAIRVFAADEA
jgi:NADPH:quinone reductase-like Zn-dependent oxidoreductase